MRKVFIVLEVSEMFVTKLESYLERTFKLISFRIKPDTSKLYEEDAYFRNIVKNVKKATEIRDNYINQHNKENE